MIDASTAIDKAKRQQINLTDETLTVSNNHARRTASTRTSTSSSNARRMALAETAAAKKEAVRANNGRKGKREKTTRSALNRKETWSY